MSDIARDYALVCQGLASRRGRVAEMQRALTACKALAPENGGQGELAKVELITGWLKACGVTDLVRVDSPDDRVESGLRPNLVARIPGRSRRFLWLFGHTDVVPPGDLSAWASDPWQVRLAGDTGEGIDLTAGMSAEELSGLASKEQLDCLHGRGVEDNQQAIASMILLAEELQVRKIRPELGLGLVFMADEECGSRHGLEHILKTAGAMFAHDDLYLVPDAGSPNADVIEVAEKSQLWLRVTTSGQQCHASTPQKGRNAFVAGAEMVLACSRELPQRFAQRDELFSPPYSTFVPSLHEANVPAINILPGRDVFCLDCRLVPGVEMNEVAGAVRQICTEVATRHGVECDVRIIQSQPASRLADDAPVTGLLRQAIRSVYGRDARAIGIGGATVAAFLRQAGCQAAVWSCIRNTCHQPNECSLISATCKDAQVFAHLLMCQGKA